MDGNHEDEGEVPPEESTHDDFANEEERYPSQEEEDEEGEIHEESSELLPEQQDVEGEEASEQQQHQLQDEDAEGDDVPSGGEDEEASPQQQETEQQQQQSEVAYSTRGRTTAEQALDPLDRLAQQALGDLGRVADDLLGPHPSEGRPGTMRESFLSDSLTEEERRTRTRYIPHVHGMHPLRKHEVKGDLALARAIHNSTGVATSLAKSKRSTSKDDSQSDENNADANNSSSLLEDEAMPHTSEDERMSDILRLNQKTFEVGSHELILPSPVFVAPSEKPSVAATAKRSPSHVEAVTAFNPPRPPESIGAKKKHRMLRWERRPDDMEIDLINYRKTVQRTQEELRNAQAEKKRLETVENHLRHHFLHHIQNMNDELAVLNTELSHVQQECVNAADLLTSRTRSRGAGKGGAYAMRDVLNVLRARGLQLQAKGLSIPDSSSSSVAADDGWEPVQGAGGVGIVSLLTSNCDAETQIKPRTPATGWVVPGDVVQCPFGTTGTVVAFFPPGPVNPNEDAHPEIHEMLHGPQQEKNKDGDAMDVDSPAQKDKQSEQQDPLPQKDSTNVVGPRVAVKLPFGVGYFPLESLKTKEDPATYSDERLATRWKGMYEIAKGVGATLDVEAMATIPDESASNGPAMELDESGIGKTIESSGTGKRRLLPFGAELLPSVNGRGSLLLDRSLEELDKALDTPLYDGGGVAGMRENRSVPKPLSEIEKLREEKVVLHARTLQLRNKLYRQRRIRMLNERTRNSTEERATRVDALVAEMRSDMKALKSRLDNEIRCIGVSEEEAERILAAHYSSLIAQDTGEPSPKRSRRYSGMHADHEEDAFMEEADTMGFEHSAAETAESSQ